MSHTEVSAKKYSFFVFKSLTFKKKIIILLPVTCAYVCMFANASEPIVFV